MDASVTWHYNLHFTGKADSGHTVTLDADTAVGGTDNGFRPLELMLISLAGCTAMDVISILKKKRQNITDFSVQVHADKAEEHPKVFTAIHVKYIIHGEQIDRTAVERAIELSTTKYCPAQAMLAKAVPITHSYVIVPATE